MLAINDLEFSNREFWTGFFITSFPTALDEEKDLSLSEMIIEQTETADINWWHKFTRYYDGVLNEADGYVDDPEMVTYNLTPAQTLKIEFHPGDTLYFVNDKQIACTGGEYAIHIFPFTDLVNFVKEIHDYRIFCLLLPLTVIRNQDADNAVEIISNVLTEIFDVNLCNQFAKSIVCGLVEE